MISLISFINAWIWGAVELLTNCDCIMPVHRHKNLKNLLNLAVNWWSKFLVHPHFTKKCMHTEQDPWLWICLKQILWTSKMACDRCCHCVTKYRTWYCTRPQIPDVWSPDHLEDVCIWTSLHTLPTLLLSLLKHFDIIVMICISHLSVIVLEKLKCQSRLILFSCGMS